ncbi:glucose-6-phosphate dehydrogenase assembly protein OpcA [bacterium]|nr:glucose-6-phosphate dehydrogenase assembly protein OpcA [bacterium]
MKLEDFRKLLFLKDTVEVDPHKLPGTLAKLYQEHQKAHPEEYQARLCTHNLLILCGSPEDAAGLDKDLDELMQHYPGRTVVVVFDSDYQGPVQGLLAQYTRKEHPAGDLVGLHFPDDGKPLPSMVAPLWVDGLPMVTIWRGHPPYESSWFLALVENCTRLVVDSGVQGGKSLEEVLAPLLPLWKLIHDPYLATQAFTDVSWARLHVWRDWIASLFDRPDRRPLLKSVESVELEGWSQPGDTVPHLSVLYLASWLSHQLDWKLSKPLHAVPGGYEVGFQPVTMRFYTRSTDDAELLGRPVRVSFRGQFQGQSFRLSVERDSNNSSTLVLGATGPACSSGASGHRLHLERLNNLALMGQELETDRRDWLFEKSLETLLEMSGNLQPEAV